MTPDLLPWELRLLTLLCHLHTDACTPARLELAMDLSEHQVRLIGAALLARRYVHALGDTWAPTSAGRLYVTHYLTTQQQERARSRQSYKPHGKVA
ncbi:hypothetical protein IHN63_03270 [Deinococcus sp. 6YEL10]|uniref:hypothetical protein n=1 Tax=Deinococcus sp. 6YEL10 TaxID=2745870 RepID=UPI001E407B7F|nr:hypothetical protein [Deinococcus sp. 6YEL10]MCD0160321.1 hypothetical protein [Deinococcus sp. 6YEL10]